MTSSLPDPAHGLDHEQQAAQSLLALLQREQTQLVAAKIDGLEQLSAEKGVLVARMATLARTRYAALTAASHSADENGMRAWLEQGQHDAAHRRWTDLLALAAAAKELNRTNGLLIGKQMVRNQAALNVLQSPGSNGNFYGPDGQSTVHGSSHRLIAG